MLTKGQHLEALQREVAEHLDVPHVVALSSCTSGLMLVYEALGLQGSVVVPSFTFMATVSSLVWSGLRPIYADVDPDTFNVDPDSVERAITSDTSAIVAVHTFGNPAAIERLEAIAKRHGLKLIFDAAHGFGSTHAGIPLGSQGDAQVFSMSPTKLLVAGEGGIVSTRDEQLAARLCRGREYGIAPGYDSEFAGLNARLAEFNALLARHGLRRLDQDVENRRSLAARFRDQLGNLPGVGLQQIAPDDQSSYKDLAITIDAARFGLNRDQLTRALSAEGIDTRSYFDPPVHRQTAYRHFHSTESSLEQTDRLSARILCLPIWSRMDPSTCDRICEAVRKIHAAADEISAMLATQEGETASPDATPVSNRTSSEHAEASRPTARVVSSLGDGDASLSNGDPS
jgi:dTDP-4-amino-4,6-dideoxygalactose transaminase